ncbi:type IV pilus secretin PilQ [Piscinibacter sakaiensis]|uniref:Type IV pilus biogenesis and competence protein PilQ n=1 Tax=Piscinibacter sakaiensis TaxID=1547922 RepID=A0A0K8NXZ4_PISS1|nr:type IV pilus secretin PilQ [Piscinibacter sakaiensis]GAP34805.1 type IV pilus biogenesis protein PilQ [Piscinibacter sakaiensis]
MTKTAEPAAAPPVTTRWLSRALVWGGLVCAAIPAWAQNAIQSVTGSQQGSTDVVRIELAQPLPAVPRGFSIQSPPRVAIDLPGVTNAMGKSLVEVNQGNLRSINVAQGDERTRLVLNLRQAATYRAEVQGRTLLVMVDTGPAVAAPPAAMAAAPAAAPMAPAAPATTSAVRPAGASATQFAESLNATAQALQNIDFRRGNDGAGRVVVDLPSNQVGVDIRQQGRTLVVDFLRSTAPDSLRRRLDVTDFGTPVQTVATYQNGDNVRMVVTPRGNWEHSAYQSDRQFVLEVRPVALDPNRLVAGPKYSGDKLSLNFQSIEVRALLQVIADFTNFNIVTSDTVTGNVTLRLKDVPWDQALDIILEAKNLGVKKTGNVLLIAPKEELATKERLELEARAQIAQLEPLRTQAFQLNYTKAEDVARGLTGQITGGGSGATTTRILSARGSVLFEVRTNQLFVNDTPSKLEEVQALIAKIDVPVRQVLIEARIVIADDKFGRSLGAKLGVTDARGVGGGNRISIGGNMNAIGAQTGQTASVDFANSQFVNLPAVGQNDYSPATFALSLFGASANRFLNLELSALEADGKGKVVSSPRVVTTDQVKALIEQGEELPYQTATSSGATAIQFRQASLKLEVTPQITPEGNVILDVDVNKDSVGRVTSAGLAIDKKHVRTQVLVENGGTVVIGGIFEQTDREDITKVPFLGDVPYLGNLFKTRNKSSSKTELLIFITPKVVTDRAAAR